MDAQVVAADPDLAARREDEAAMRRFARAGASTEAGMRSFHLRAGLGVIARLEATVDYLARGLAALGDGDDEDARRVKACVILANPHHAVELLAAYAEHRRRHGQGPSLSTDPPPTDPAPPDEWLRYTDLDTVVDTDPRPLRPDEPPPWQPPDTSGRPSGVFTYDPSTLLPPVTLYVHTHRDTLDHDTGGVVRVEGAGPLSLQWVHDHVRPAHRFRIQPVLDLAEQAPVDAYEIPERHREAAQLLTPADCFPFATRVGRPADPGRPSMDVDHTVPHPLGPSRLGNYGQLTRTHHRIKTHGQWQVQQPFPGIFVWRDPHGRHYLVDHTGTRRTRPVSTEDLRRRPADPTMRLATTDLADLGRRAAALTHRVPAS